MNRDEFMELVYETFADEPDNVLANGIIEAADAYVEHEKTQTVERLRGVLDVTVPITDYDGGYVDGVEVGISTVSTMPTIQPVATDTSVGGTISRQRALDALAKFVPYAICDESTESYTNGLTDAYNLILQMPSAQPDKSMIEDCLYHIRRNTSVHTSAEGVVAIKHYMGEIWRELFGEEDMPKWMT